MGRRFPQPSGSFPASLMASRRLRKGTSPGSSQRGGSTLARQQPRQHRLAVGPVNLTGRDEGLVGVEAKLGLEALGVVGLEGDSVDAAGSLQFGTEADGGGELDDRGPVGDGHPTLSCE